MAFLLILGTSCTKDFEEINSDPNKVEEIDPGYLLTRIWMKYNGSPHEEHRGNLIMAGPLGGIVQCAYRTGQAFQGNSDGYNEAKMVEMYKSAMKNGNTMLNNLRRDGASKNEAKIAIGTITMQYSYALLTDLYGDIPYHEGGKGYSENILYPKYDSQEDIYKSSVDSLIKYRDILLSTKTESFAQDRDILFGGFADDGLRKEAWAKAANSLILRMGMRASAADESWAKATVEEAAASPAGFFTGITSSDAAIMKTGLAGGDWGAHINGANALISNGQAYSYVGEEWLRMAQQNRDPRIFYVACLAVNDGGVKAWTDMTEFDAFAEAARPGQPWKPVTFEPLRAGGTESYSVRGLYSVDGNRQFCDWMVDPNKDVEYSQYHTLAMINPETIGNRETPIVVFGGDETYYILAEAAQRGWSVPGSASENLQKALELTFDKYPQLYEMGASSPKEYMEKQSIREGKQITYQDLKDTYINNVMGETLDLELIWRERWKSLMTTFTYQAFPLWNRTNLKVVSQERPFPGTEFMDLPAYSNGDLDNLVLGQEVAPTKGYTKEPFHNGGDTEGFRPRRINYPNSERANNGAHVEEAMQHQISAYGQVGTGSHFITTRMWISKK